MRCLYRRSAPSNSILLTEQCNHYCLMCSQPPKTRDDSWLLREAFELISIIPTDTKELILTGGEPTLYGPRLVELLNHAKQCLPNTAIHLLSNGRAFKDFTFAKLYAAVEHPDLMIGIPVYADDPTTHDYVVQSRGAFDDTIRGILNLKKLRQRVEVRLVIHKQTVSQVTTDLRVPGAKFIVRGSCRIDGARNHGLHETQPSASLDRSLRIQGYS